MYRESSIDAAQASFHWISSWEISGESHAVIGAPRRGYPRSSSRSAKTARRICEKAWIVPDNTGLDCCSRIKDEISYSICNEGLDKRTQERDVMGGRHDKRAP